MCECEFDIHLPLFPSTDVKGETWPELPVPSPEAEQEAILEGDYTPFPEEWDPEATPGQEGTPPAEANPYLAEPAKEVPTETAGKGFNEIQSLLSQYGN